MKLQNAGVLWLSGFFVGGAAIDATNVLQVNISTWGIVGMELTVGALIMALAFHPFTSGKWINR